MAKTIAKEEAARLQLRQLHEELAMHQRNEFKLEF